MDKQQILENMEISTTSSPLACQHESNGVVYASLPPQYKCKKCGTFYNM